MDNEEKEESFKANIELGTPHNFFRNSSQEHNQTITVSKGKYFFWFRHINSQHHDNLWLSTISFRNRTVFSGVLECDSNDPNDLVNNYFSRRDAVLNAKADEQKQSRRLGK